MAPSATPKTLPKVKRTIIKNSKAKASPVSTVKKTLASNNATEKTVTVNNSTLSARPRTSTVPKMSTPKPKQNKSVPLPGSVTKSVKKSWKRRPKPAHSGVPVPEKMKKLLDKQLQDSD